MKKTREDYKNELRVLRIELNDMIRQRNDANGELNQYRRFITDKLKWYVELNGKNKYPEMVGLIISYVKFFSSRKTFDWEF